MLVLGAGQLGMAVLRALAPRVKQAKTPLSVLVWPGSISNPSASDKRINAELLLLGVNVIPFDLASAGEDLAELFRRFHTVVNCTGFVGGLGTQLRITNAALEAGVKRFFPWQFGVDYDVVGKGSGQPVFDEQYEVRQLLRAQDRTEWVIVSTGMFTSFLFEPAFDVVNLEAKTVHGLGSWDTRVTVTTPEDVGRLTTEILLEEPRIVDRVVYVAGDTISYGHLADVVDRVTGSTFHREEWTLDKLHADLAAAPEDVMTRYRAGFALGDGMWWDKASTYNAHKGIATHDVEDWLRVRLEETVA
ncbi:MAG: aromatic alcohol reductase [Rhodanobacter sp.]